MAGTQCRFACWQGALKQCQRFGEVAACRARFREPLQRADGDHVIRLEHFLSNAQRISVQRFRRGLIAESVFHEGEVRERGGDIGMLLALDSCDRE
jgi:hypothetical protein